MSHSFNELFSNPPADLAEAVAKEQARGLEELELMMGGMMRLEGGTPPQDESEVPNG